VLSDGGGMSFIRIEKETCFGGGEPSLIGGVASAYRSIEYFRNDSGELFSIVVDFFIEFCFFKVCFFFFKYISSIRLLNFSNSESGNESYVSNE